MKSRCGIMNEVSRTDGRSLNNSIANEKPQQQQSVLELLRSRAAIDSRETIRERCGLNVNEAWKDRMLTRIKEFIKLNLNGATTEEILNEFDEDVEVNNKEAFRDLLKSVCDFDSDERIWKLRKHD